MCIHSEKNNNALAEYILEFAENSYVLLDVIYYSITEFQRFVTCLINVLHSNRYILCLVLIAMDDLISSFRFCIKETDFNGLESTASLEQCELSKIAFSTIVQTVCAILCFERIAKKIRWFYPNSIFLIRPNAGNAPLQLYIYRYQLHRTAILILLHT